MNYIGSKNKLSSFIVSTVQEIVGSNLKNLIFCDLFAGTGIVGRTFKPLVKQVISNDVEFYSYILNRNYIGNHSSLDYDDYIKQLNDCSPKKGFIFENYGELGTAGRLYFSKENAQKIDAIRIQIEAWFTASVINEDMYYFLLASLLESADKVANTASVYGAYLKKIKVSARKKLVIAPATYNLNEGQFNVVFQKDANELIQEIKGDILYLDPPYNARQYGANYHLLTTIAKYDTFVPKGKTGLRDYYKSDYCSKNKVLNTFEVLIKEANFKYIFLSYNNEGLMSQKDVEAIMKRYGDYTVATTKYQRFKADKTESRNHKANSTTEYLHILKKK
ncbi:DNA adenine methylase [Patiriisocius marinus]|uniref:site-specific DNA-methyltransferase (adenine-specific) n=1 Tax=Patiriisocius marinus TaxID=1397112 RepID=A0A5J4IYK1_9FLAO|nr:DNA adenine methylase [Patiriisocius marinus]GER58738.1 restriction endonuclease subunit M [Patiriisocius marinus]